MLQEPNQSTISFPKTKFSDCNRSFQKDWYHRFSWIHYDIEKDAAFCFSCIKALSMGAISSGNVEPAFVKTGYRNWKRACEVDRGFMKHCASEAHREAVERVVKAPVENRNAGEMLSSGYQKEKELKRNALFKIITNLRYLGIIYLNFQFQS